MSVDWQPIETAPTETPCLVTDGEYFAVGQTWLFTEADTIGYDYTMGGKWDSVFGNDERPNPDAGKTRWVWNLNGCTAYSMESYVGCDWDHAITEFKPTHWTPVISRPATEEQPSELYDISVKSTNP